jgi:F-type H+-transporting ATPase subunit a
LAALTHVERGLTDGTEGAVADATAPTPAAPASRRSTRSVVLGLIAAVIVIDVLALLFVPPHPKGEPGAACAFPVCFINGSLEFPPPHVVIDLDPAHELPTGAVVIGFDLSITSTILTMWIVTAILLVAVIGLTRGLQLRPGGRQNLIEFAYETLSDFATSLGGPRAKPYIPLFAALFIYILFSNWSGLVPPIGKVDELRAPTSDLNITAGLALVAFLIFEFEGFRRNGVRGYLSKFFPIGSFKEGIGAGILAMYVGLIELLLEFIKPLTLSMRLFGNIFGGEVALGVITALTIAVIPAGMLLLEGLLNFVQALIFSTLMLMYTIIAVEAHHTEEHEGVADVPEGGMAPPLSVGATGH